MSQEIERKFLVTKLPAGLIGKTILQGYLQSEKERAVRIRIVEQDSVKRGLLTIKGIGDIKGISRYEFETEIPLTDAQHLLTLCDQPLIEKTRFLYEYEGLIWEIDVFHGANEGLIIAEIELEREDQKFNRPDFIGEEVTGKVKYYSLMLTKEPYNVW